MLEPCPGLVFHGQVVEVERVELLPQTARGKAFFSFTLSWNEYLYAIVFNSNPEVRTLPTGISNFIVEDVFFWGPIMGSTFLTALPPLAMYFIFQRWLVSGLTMGAVRG